MTLGFEDKVRKYALENFQENTGSYALEVAEATGASMPLVCNMLREMKEEGILSRRRNVRRWEYFLLEPHDTEEYLADKRAEVIISKKFGALHTQISKLKKTVKLLDEAAKKYELNVGCICGRRIGIKLSTEVVDNNDSG